MRGIRRSIRLVVMASVAAVVLTACSDENGHPLPGGSNTPPTTQISTAPPSEPEQGAGELAAVKACELLTDQEIGTISKGFAVGRQGPMGGSSDGCSWATSIDRGVPIEKAVSLGIDIRPQETTDQANVGIGTATDGDVEGRKAKQVAEVSGDGSCMLTFAAEAGRVDIVVTTKQTERSCEIASDVSTLIEPKLPKPTA